MLALEPQAAEAIDVITPTAPSSRNTAQPARTHRIGGEELAALQQQLQTGERTSLAVNESRELVEELRFLRWQLQRIRITQDSARQRAIAEEALYGERTALVVLSVHSG